MSLATLVMEQRLEGILGFWLFLLLPIGRAAKSESLCARRGGHRWYCEKVPGASSEVVVVAGSTRDDVLLGQS